MTLFSKFSAFQQFLTRMPFDCTMFPIYCFVQSAKVILIRLETQSISVSNNRLKIVMLLVAFPFFSFTYSMGLPCLFFHMYFRGSLGSNFTISSPIVVPNNMCMSGKHQECLLLPRTLLPLLQ